MSAEGAPDPFPGVRVLAREINEATVEFRDGDGEKDPLMRVLPTGRFANRASFVGTITEVEDVGTDGPYWRGRIVGPADEIAYVYADAQYDPAAAATLDRMDAEGACPQYVYVRGKFNDYETDSGGVNVYLSPESVNVIDQESYHAWVVAVAQDTVARVEEFRQFRDGAREQFRDDGPGADRATEMGRAVREYGGGHDSFIEDARRALEDVVEAEEPATGART